MKPNTTTLAIKARVLNKYRSKFYNKSVDSFSQEEKNNLFNELFTQVSEIHDELNCWKQKRKERNVVQKLRNERGFIPKKKTSLEEYRKMLETV